MQIVCQAVKDKKNNISIDMIRTVTLFVNTIGSNVCCSYSSARNIGCLKQTPALDATVLNELFLVLYVSYILYTCIHALLYILAGTLVTHGHNSEECAEAGSQWDLPMILKLLVAPSWVCL